MKKKKTEERNNLFNEIENQIIDLFNKNSLTFNEGNAILLNISLMNIATAIKLNPEKKDRFKEILSRLPDKLEELLQEIEVRKKE